MDHYSEILPDVLVNLSLLDRQLYYDTIGQRDIWGYLEAKGVALLGHFVFTGGGHGDAYVNIRDLNTIKLLAPIAMQLAWEARHLRIDAIVGTPHGADTLAVLVAYYYSQFHTRAVEVLKPLKSEKGLVWYKDHGARAKGAYILQVEDVINSAKSVRETITFLLQSQSIVSGIATVCNRISDKNPGLEFLKNKSGAKDVFALTDVTVANYAVDPAKDPRKQCPLCFAGIPIDTRVGHGVKFLASIQDTYPELYKKLS